MSPTEALPLLVVVLLLVSASGADVQQMDVTFAGDQTVDAVDDVLVVAGGTSVVPSGTTVTGDVYVIGGETEISGAVEGDVTVLAGSLSVRDGGMVSGTLRTLSGESTVAPGASVGRISRVDPPTPNSSPAQRLTTFLLQFLVLGSAGWWLASRHPRLLDNVGAAVTEHTLVSGVIGALAGATLLVLFVYMAFTLVLLPLSIAGLVAELVVALYGQVVFGHLLGQRLPIAGRGAATVAGVGALLLVLELLGELPYVGALVQFGIVVVGIGAVLNTYFGLQRFEPITIPDAE